jgi:hypothetical protein
MQTLVFLAAGTTSTDTLRFQITVPLEILTTCFHATIQVFMRTSGLITRSQSSALRRGPAAVRWAPSAGGPRPTIAARRRKHIPPIKIPFHGRWLRREGQSDTQTGTARPAAHLPRNSRRYAIVGDELGNESLVEMDMYGKRVMQSAQLPQEPPADSPVVMYPHSMHTVM